MSFATIQEAWGAPFAAPPPAAAAAEGRQVVAPRLPRVAPPARPRPSAALFDGDRRAARRYVDALFERRGVAGVLAFLGRRVARALRRELCGPLAAWLPRGMTADRLLFAMLCALAVLLVLDAAVRRR